MSPLSGDKRGLYRRRAKERAIEKQVNIKEIRQEREMLLLLLLIELVATPMCYVPS